MHFFCPHCQNPLEVVADATEAEETLCPTCGSSFHLDPEATKPFPRSQQKVGRFELLGRLGVGGFGAVWKAWDPELDRMVAVKMPHPARSANGDEWARCRREARSVAQLRHPGIVTLFEVAELDGAPVLVSDFIEGVTLADHLTAGELEPFKAAELVHEVALALHYAHSMGVVHRDVKPSNILLKRAGNNGSVHPVVMDFGLALRDTGETTMTMDGDVLGTPAYMSPEQASGQSHKVDGRTDVYSLGVILYRLLTGGLPFRGNSRMLLLQVMQEEPVPPRRLNRRIPRDLEIICLKAMAKDPSRRYDTAQAMADDLRRFLDGEAILARPLSSLERVVRFVRRRPAEVLAAMSLIIAVLSIAAAVFFYDQNQRLNRAIRSENAARKLAQESGQRADAANMKLRLAIEEMRLAKEQQEIALQKEKIALQKEKEVQFQLDEVSKALADAHKALIAEQTAKRSNETKSRALEARIRELEAQLEEFKKEKPGKNDSR